MDDASAFVMHSALMLNGGFYILRQRLSAGIKLAGPDALALPCHRKAKAAVATLAKPSQVIGCPV